MLLLCGILGWSSSYRLAYLRMPRDHFLLLAVILFIAWLGILHSLARYRLLNRKIFVSRKVVYSVITPIVFSVFFILVGIMSMLTRYFGWPVPYALHWVIIILGGLAITLLTLSESARKQVKYFISNHFFVNKYEYRDEWLAFSNLLRGRLTAREVTNALYQILRDCLYARTILIWIGDVQRGFQLIPVGNDQGFESTHSIRGDDPIVSYLLQAPYLYSREGHNDRLHQSILMQKDAFLKVHDIILMVPMISGDQCVGLIGLGPETTSGAYGPDDFDLLAALGSHAASAQQAAQHAEALSQIREQFAWRSLSAFILHDIKNAATLLDLALNNAHQHISKPDFQ